MHWIRLFLSGNTRTVIFLVILSIITPIFGWFNVEITRRLFDGLTIDPELKKLIVYASILLLITIVQGISSQYDVYLKKDLSIKTSNNIESDFLRNILNPGSLNRIESPHYIEDYGLLHHSLKNLQHAVPSIISLFNQLVLVSMYSFLLLSINKNFIYIICIVFFLRTCIEYLLNSRYEKRIQHDSQINLKANKFSNLIAQQATQKDILIFNSKEFLLGKWSRFIKESYKNIKKFNKYEYFMRNIFGFINPISILILQIIMFTSFIQGNISLGDFMAAITAFGTLDTSISSMVANVKYVKSIKILKSRLKNFKENYSDFKEIKSECVSIEKITLNNLFFKYIVNKDYSLKNINLDLELNDVVVIVGNNGSGKSTLGKIIIGLYDVPDNNLKINDFNVNELNRKSIYENISYVAQDYVKYPVSIYENIYMKEKKEEEESSDIIKKIKSKYSTLLPDEMLEDIDSPLGSEFLNSKQLSGGQWKRLSIARALSKESTVLLLDEATNELDPNTELSLIRDIIDNRKDKITIIVTHNLSISEYANKIVVLKNGEIAETGNFDELIANGQEFYSMWRKQNAKGKEDIIEKGIEIRAAL